VKTLGIEQATLDSCEREAQGDRVLLTRDGAERVTGPAQPACSARSNSNRGTALPSISTVSVNIAAGRTHRPRSPFSCR